MKRLFHIQPDYRLYRYEIDAIHEWGFSGLDCAVCGTVRRTLGICYPAVDLSCLPDAKKFYRPPITSLADFEARRQEVLPLLPEGAVVEPGTKFGPLIGTIQGSVPDVAFVLTSHVLSTTETLRQLENRGVRGITAAPAQLRSRRKNTPTMIEWQIAVCGDLTPAAFEDIGPQPVCPACGYAKEGRIKQVVVSEDSIPAQVDIFRLRNGPTVVVATEAFVDAVRARELTGLAIQEVTVAPGR